MPLGSTYDIHRIDKRLEQRMLGGQQYLAWADAGPAQGVNPAGLNAAAPQGMALGGQELRQLAAMIAGTLTGSTTVTALGPGTYSALFPISGFTTSVALDLNFTFAGGTVTINAFTTQKDEQTSRQTFTGNGTTLTSATPSIGAVKCTSLAGEQYAVMQVVVGAGCSVTAIGLAEYVGL